MKKKAKNPAALLSTISIQDHYHKDFQGLIPPPHTPFKQNGDLNLDVVVQQAELFIKNGISRVFVAGSTGEFPSLSIPERKALNERWVTVCRNTSLKVIVHVGSSCMEDSQSLAAQANKLGALAIAATAPYYFKVNNVESLALWCKQIAAAAPEKPFYYYHIPEFTGENLNMAQFTPLAIKHIKSFAGLKYTDPDLLTYQECVRNWGNRYEMLWGLDELLLSALTLGCKGAVGSTYNFAAPLYYRLINAFNHGKLDRAREEQYKAVEMINLLNQYGFMGATKAVMKMIGIDVGPVRPPNRNLTPAEEKKLQKELEKLGFFDWIKP